MEFQITVEGRTIAAQPRPEDQETLERLLARGTDVTIAQSDKDTEGHNLAADEIFVDVEGHAMTLRLPAAGDAAALRRALAVGALTASVAIGGFVAGTQVGSQASPLTAPAAATVSSGATGTYAESEKGPYTGTYATSEKGSGYTGTYITSEKGDNPTVSQPISGPLPDPGVGKRGPKRE
jgi:hypothetical protein